MGNASTTDFFCGQDPNFTIVHDDGDPDKHFDGCGFTSDQCTSEACCDDISTAQANNTPMTTEQIRTCFISNMQSKGQCCECDEGWTGYG